MLSIQYSDFEETIEIGELFAELGVDSAPVGLDGEICIKNDFAIQVKSLDEFYDIEAFRMTNIEKVSQIRTEKGHSLYASPEHIVLSENGWKKIQDLFPGEKIMTADGLVSLASYEKNCLSDQKLYDLQVSICHSYFSDNILSHNSHFLTMLGANALKAKKNVLHYTFELSAEQIGLRYDSNLCAIDSNDLIENKDIVIEMYKGMDLGRLFIKYYPTNTASVNTLKAHVEKLSLKGFRPDIILIDYADIMKSTRQFDSLRHELTLVYRELRGLAGELGVPIATASQVNREGAEAEIVDVTNMSEAFGKVFIADVVLTISRRSVEKASGWGRLFMAKNRFGRDGLVYNTKINTARSTFEVSGESTTPEMAGSEDKSDTHTALLEKWKKFQAS